MQLQEESPTYVLNEDTQPVIRTIGESHTQLAKTSFDEIFDLTAEVYFNFYNIIMTFAVHGKYIYIYYILGVYIYLVLFNLVEDVKTMWSTTTSRQDDTITPHTYLPDTKTHTRKTQGLAHNECAHACSGE